MSAMATRHRVQMIPMLRTIAWAPVVLVALAGCVIAAEAVAQPAGRNVPPSTAQAVPELPPGAVRLVSFTHRGDKVALCAEEPGGPIEHGARQIARTRVWIDDGTKVRLVGTEPGSCDPAWSFDGERVAVVAPDGLWVLSADLRLTMHLVDTRHREAPGDERAHRTLSSPAWSPDGRYLAFVVTGGESVWVEAVHAQTGDTAHTSDPETYEFSWASDSRSLRFGSRVERLASP